MTNFGPIRFVVGFLSLVVLCAFVAPRRASAGNVTITLNPGPLTVTEGNNITLNYTVTNNTGSTIFGDGLPQFIVGYQGVSISGDSSDDLDFATGIFSGTCSSESSLSNGANCTLSFTFTAGSTTGEKENSDFAIDQVIAIFEYDCPNCLGDTDPFYTPGGYFRPVNSSAFVRSSDPSATPEPSSLLLLGTGLLGLLAAKGLEPLIRLLARTS
ncbi:MAG TPA: PEP-CTERM sorting domain-containing protein [Candidatus Acidoferrales bacterium]|nr:PEP-CTERM sorting domain-containing protein [Candidatus Acidoferrales bacterium]